MGDRRQTAPSAATRRRPHSIDPARLAGEEAARSWARRQWPGVRQKGERSATFCAQDDVRCIAARSSERGLLRLRNNSNSHKNRRTKSNAYELQSGRSTLLLYKIYYRLYLFYLNQVRSRQLETGDIRRQLARHSDRLLHRSPASIVGGD